MKQKLLVGAATVILMSCSSKTELHVYNRYLSAKEQMALVSAIDKEQFKVNFTEQPFPNSISDSAIVYGPSANSRSRLDTLIATLDALGYPLTNANLLAANNHSFSENNVGVFLVPLGTKISHTADFDNRYDIPMINEYGAIDCPDATTLYLKSSQLFMIEISRWQEKQQDYLTSYIEGQWHSQTDRYIVLESDEWQQSLIFERSAFERKEINGISYGMKLTPLKTVNKSMSSASVNCSYSISVSGS